MATNSDRNADTQLRQRRASQFGGTPGAIASFTPILLAAIRQGPLMTGNGSLQIFNSAGDYNSPVDYINASFRTIRNTAWFKILASGTPLTDTLIPYLLWWPASVVTPTTSNAIWTGASLPTGPTAAGEIKLEAMTIVYNAVGALSSISTEASAAYNGLAAVSAPARSDFGPIDLTQQINMAWAFVAGNAFNVRLNMATIEVVN